MISEPIPQAFSEDQEAILKARFARAEDLAWEANKAYDRLKEARGLGLGMVFAMAVAPPWIKVSGREVHNNYLFEKDTFEAYKQAAEATMPSYEAFELWRPGGSRVRQPEPPRLPRSANN